MREMEILALLSTLFWIIMLIHCLFNRGLRGGQKLFWLFLIFLIPIFGTVLYFFFGRQQAIRQRYQVYRSTQRQRQSTYWNQQPYYQPRQPQQPYYQPTPAQPTRTERAAAQQSTYYQPQARPPEPEQSYQTGYSAQSPSREKAGFETEPGYNQYDYPQASYPDPEQPQQQAQAQ
ncbi:PLD nuclease N-terminal domain-containing protein [Dictyobacter arantiisoli]|uniref:Cardiolipin synthase N-terminal domain-containing protein n=1 Tax=Dictyobacter arantiisoli TaxID=2014874 RepID=A0A5A5TD29_9CHLR|nr:PLD nuclease N-terminal domain-containing protein [Dictyobacter arantiisoli]GCF08929.1 hypothetical protein KDI_24930 [Dictyobacter arantiisoli]